MYLPEAFAVEDRAEILEVLRVAGLGHFVTTSADDQSGLTATALPFVVDDHLTTLRAHFSRANRHWRSVDGAAALVIVPIVDAYVSPRWYPGKQEHGKVVPTWNYELVHLHGRLQVRDEPVETLAIVNALTDQHEARLSGQMSTRTEARHRADLDSTDSAETDLDSTDSDRAPSAVADAPDDFIANQLKAIVGVELHIDRIEAKRKLSQNRAAEDRLGAMTGLSSSTAPRDQATASRMRDIADDRNS